MRDFGRKDGTITLQLEAVDVVDFFPNPVDAHQGKVIFKKGDGLFVFVDGAWTPAYLRPHNPRAPNDKNVPPKTFEFDGVMWDITPDGKQSIMDSAMRALLYSGEAQSSPSLITTAGGQKMFLASDQVVNLAKAMLDFLNSQRS